MRRLIAVLFVAGLVGASTPALAARPEKPPSDSGQGRGCSLEDWRVVVETDKVRLCLIEREG